MIDQQLFVFTYVYISFGQLRMHTCGNGSVYVSNVQQLFSHNTSEWHTHTQTRCHIIYCATTAWRR